MCPTPSPFIKVLRHPSLWTMPPSKQPALSWSGPLGPMFTGVEEPSVRSLASELLYSLIYESGTTAVPAPKSHCEEKPLKWQGSSHTTCWVQNSRDVRDCLIVHRTRDVQVHVHPGKWKHLKWPPDGWMDKGTWPISTVEY